MNVEPVENPKSPPDPCLRAARRLHAALQKLATEIDETGDAETPPSFPLPVDCFLSGMLKRKNAPRIVYVPEQLSDQRWTASTTAFVYAGIEQAFTSAGMMPGGNAAGYVKKLKDLRKWINTQLRDPALPTPKYFPQKTARLFSKGVLRDRRTMRIALLYRIDQGAPTLEDDLVELRRLVDQDLAEEALRRSGRPAQYQKIVFAAEIANLWNDLTGQPIAKGPETNFARFVEACWGCGEVDRQRGTSFKLTLRKHIEEEANPAACGRCATCEKSKPCSRKRYYGILI